MILNLLLQEPEVLCKPLAYGAESRDLAHCASQSSPIRHRPLEHPLCSRIPTTVLPRCPGVGNLPSQREISLAHFRIRVAYLPLPARP
jgi:hypothetical protein